MKKVLVTGGAGFIGSNFILYLMSKYPDYEIVNLDKLTYAGRLENLSEVEDDPRYSFVKGDICNLEIMKKAAAGCNYIVSLAAETHVDRSIIEAGSFVTTDVYGVYSILEAAKECGVERTLLVSTDEVYGSVPKGESVEDDPPLPRSPYAASKAGGELLARSYYETYGVPVLLTRGANTIGPHQYPEKATPLFITNAIDDTPLPIYGDGKALRDYVYVLDHCEAIDLVLHHGAIGEAYNVGAGNQVNTIELSTKILDLLGKPEGLMKFVTDRPGHDLRYSLDSSKIKSLGWSPRYDFDAAIEATVDWYRENQDWWREIKSGEFAQYYERQYGSLKQNTKSQTQNPKEKF